MPILALMGYQFTQHLCIGLTKSLAREVGKSNITVNAILPGYMKTEMTSGIEDEKLNTIIRQAH